MPDPTGTALVGAAMWGQMLYHTYRPRKVGIYGTPMVGKTTLHHQLRTRGEVQQIKERTVGRHRASRKYVKLDGDAHTLKTADIGGEAIYWKEWLKDMRERKVKYVIFMIDHRHLDNALFVAIQ